MRVYLVHHGEAVGSEVDLRRPLSERGRSACEALAADAARRGAKPDVVWHSGKLRAKQTAEIYWRSCNALAEFAAARDLQPDDPPLAMRDRLRFEPRTLMLAGHYPHLPRLLALMLDAPEAVASNFPMNGVVALRSEDDGRTWTEEWRLEPPRR